jgi:hypothetical protein
MRTAKSSDTPHHAERHNLQVDFATLHDFAGSDWKAWK